ERQPAHKPGQPVDEWKGELWSSRDAEELDRLSEPVIPDPTFDCPAIGEVDPIMAIRPAVQDTALTTIETAGKDPTIAALDRNAAIDLTGTLAPSTTIENTGAAASPIGPEAPPLVGDENPRNDPNSHSKLESTNPETAVSATEANNPDRIEHRGET